MPNGVCVFIDNKWWMQLAKYPRVSWRVNIISIRLKNQRGCIFTKYCRTSGDIAQTTWIVSPLSSTSNVSRRGVFTTSNTLVGRGDLLIHSHSRLLSLLVAYFSHRLPSHYHLFPWYYVYHRKQRDCVWAYARRVDRMFSRHISLCIIDRTKSFKIFQ